MRIRHLEKILSSLFFLLLLGLLILQVFQGKSYRLQSQGNIIRLIPMPAPRGEISDRNGVLLADTHLTLDLALIPQETKNLNALVEKLSRILGVDRERMFQVYAKGLSAPFTPVPVVKDISKEMAISLEERRDLPGTVVMNTPHRRYLYGIETAHLLGRLGEIDPWELERLRPYGYKMKDLLGQGGIEESFDNYLRGEDGGVQLKVNNKGFKVETLGSRRPVKGKDLTLTLDIRLQGFITSLLQGRPSAVCVMNPQTGEILALASSPSFDPNGDISPLLHSQERPFLNRVTQGLYPPGSTFKVAIAATALETRKIGEQTSFFCPGSLTLGKDQFDCWREGGHGEQRLIGALQHSCNVFFYHAGLLTGPDLIAEYARFFGFGEKSSLELPHEAKGFVPNSLWKRLAKRERWYDGETVNFAIGQGYLTVTPLQVLRMASAIATDGKLVDPYLVKRIGVLETKAGKTRHLPLSKKTLAAIQEGMFLVVNSDEGTGRYAAVPGLEIAGKTGTAQVHGKAPHAWFVGYSPSRDPRASLVVFMEHGGKGGLVASQIAASIFQKMKELELL